MLYLYVLSSLTAAERKLLIQHGLDPNVVEAEWCYVVEPEEELDDGQYDRLASMLAGPTRIYPMKSSRISAPYAAIVGPQLGFETPAASTMRTIAARSHVPLRRIEQFRRYGLPGDPGSAVLGGLHDRMTQSVYTELPQSLQPDREIEPVTTVPVTTRGLAALQAANDRYGLAMDGDDLGYYLDLFTRLGRDATVVELFELGIGNSEHSRHQFFRGKLVVDGEPWGISLMDIVQEPYLANPNNSEIAFHDDSSAIRGREHWALAASRPGFPSPLMWQRLLRHPTLTAETHNFPTGVAPYPGGATGTGGRIRDNQAVGRGGLVVASGFGLAAGNLCKPGYDLPWEQDGRSHPVSLASPLQIQIEGSNGAFDYGNCFGEPVIIGHARTFGMWVAGEYRAWFKPVLYTEGFGQIDNRHLVKWKPQAGMLMVQLGGPAYRIGMGGASASSRISDETDEADVQLDFNAVQRPDPEMEQRLNRVIRACVEMGATNPIISAHDLGAGGDANALPEIADPAGARIDLRAIPSGDPTLSVREIWGNESQERVVILINPYELGIIEALCRREAVPCAVVGEITGDGQLVVFDSSDGTTPVNLPLEPILGAIPLKTIKLETIPILLPPLDLPEALTVEEGLNRILGLVAVGSKGWLTNKVDRSVTGRVAQQQGVGPFDFPLSDAAAIGNDLLDYSGVAYSQGERPIVGLISPAAQGRMTVGEALTNLAGMKITGLPDIRCSANWMWAAKLPGEGARMVEAALAKRDIMLELGMATDGGKDSLTMASKDAGGTVKAPGQLVIGAYVEMPDVRRKATPDFKRAGNQVIYIDLARGQARLGGSALAQTFRQVGNECPDVDDVGLLRRAFWVLQEQLQRKLFVSIHDRSDGGLVTTLVEMCIAGNRGGQFDIRGEAEAIPALFAEELGWVLEVQNPTLIKRLLNAYEIPYQVIGRVGDWNGSVAISYNGQPVLEQGLSALRSRWAETSYQMETVQSNPETAAAEWGVLSSDLPEPQWRLTYTPRVTPSNVRRRVSKPKLAVVREQGSNGDRELAASFMAAGFEVWDITMSDLENEAITLDQFRGVGLPGGFSFGDVLGSAKGWADTIRNNPQLAEQFQRFFHEREDTFSFAPCNGFQLATWLDLLKLPVWSSLGLPSLVHNRSERFESRRVTVTILDSPAIMLRDMAGSTLGVWVAHGEGQLVWPDQNGLQAVVEGNLAPLRYADPLGNLTEQYPYNPNGSALGIAGLCSPDGRHFAGMPHQERLASQPWQWPWLPDEWARFTVSPWLKMFQNAYEWCVGN